MAPRKNNSRNGGGSSGKSLSVFRLAGKGFSAVFFIMLGGLLFNLDRMDNAGIVLLKYKEFLPSLVRKCLPGAGASYGKAAPKQELKGKVIEVYDGDTMTLLADSSTKYKVRFYAIDAPEAAQSYGLNSRDTLREKILGKEVVVKVVNVDRYQRVVGMVMLGGRYINLEMVKEGMAWYYSDYAARQYEFSEAERRAKSEKLGLWKKKDPEAPWKWRKKHKK